jgi:protein SCO1/2
MKIADRFTLCALLSALCAFTLTNESAAQSISSNVKPDILNQIGIEQRLNESIPLDLTFLDESGESVKLQKYFVEKPVVLALVYYECPMLCSMVLNGLLKSINALSFDVGNEFDILTVSFDPAETSGLAAAKKTSYLSKYGRAGSENGWHFLTGEQESIKKLTEAVGFKYTKDPMTDEFVHASGIMVLTPGGKLSKYFYGVEYSSRDLKLGLMEAATEKIGTPVDQILLYCYHYDPTTGKYGVAIMNVIRVAGIATVLAICSFMLLMLRRDRVAKRKTAIESHRPTV